MGNLKGPFQSLETELMQQLPVEPRILISMLGALPPPRPMPFVCLCSCRRGEEIFPLLPRQRRAPHLTLAEASMRSKWPGSSCRLDRSLWELLCLPDTLRGECGQAGGSRGWHSHEGSPWAQALQQAAGAHPGVGLSACQSGGWTCPGGAFPFSSDLIKLCPLSPHLPSQGGGPMMDAPTCW